jgi:hypothetical protein
LIALDAQLDGYPKLRINHLAPVQRGMDGQAIRRVSDIVHAEYMCTRPHSVHDRRERAGEALAGRATGDRADEVLARDGKQQGPLE